MAIRGMRDHEENADAVFIVAMEVGSRWPLWSNRVRVGVPHLVTIVQHSDQTVASLVSRVLKLVASTQAKSRRVGTLVIACNERSDRNALIARAQMVKAAYGAMSSGGQVLLTADETVAESSRKVMGILAASLAESAPDPEIQVELSFGAASSGVFPASAEVAKDPPDVAKTRSG